MTVWVPAHPNLLDAITVSSKSDPSVGNAFGLRVSGFPSAFIKNASTSTDVSRRFVRFGERLLPDMYAFTGQDCLVPEADLSAMRC